ncbi:MAG TPA: serine hydrolase [Anaerolineales bacterium]|nr:serine hydrolase [Anaerolineales bacterium]
MKRNHLWITLAVFAGLLLTGCGSRTRVGALRSESQSVELGDAKSVRVEINMGAGDLEVTGGADKLLEADFTYNVARLKPEVKYTDSTLVVRQPDANGLPALQGITDFRNEWGLRLSDGVPIDLRVDLGAGTSNLKLAGLLLTGLDVSLGAGEYTIDLTGDWTRDLEVTMNTGAANISLKLPADIGVRVEVEPGPNMIEATGLTQDGNVYTNAAHGVSEVTLQVNLDAGIGQIKLEMVDEHSQAKVALQELLDQQVKQQNTLGMVMAERLADGTVIWATSGYTSPSGNERWSADTPSLIASVTKTFTAVVVMQLMEEGKLSLDDTVDAWFPEQPNGDKITVRMLLSHTSGLADYQTVFGMDPGKWTRAWAPEDLIAEANKAGPVGEPGSKVIHYSNTNYFMLGLIIEKVTGNSWAHEVESRIIKPLDLKDTTCPKDDNGQEIAVPGYIKTSDGYLGSDEFPWYPHASTAWAAGLMVSSASDLLTFASALFDGRLVSRETLAVMTQPMGSVDGRAFALGGVVFEVAGRKAFGMTGDSTTGYHAFFVGIPDSKLAVTALVNTVEGNVISPGLAALEYISQQIEKK